MKMSDFQRGLMLVLIEDDDCLIKLIALKNEKQFDAVRLEDRAKELRNEQKEIEELIIFLREPPK